MGNDHSKNKKNKFNPKHMDPNKLNIILKQIYFTAQLYRDRRKGQQSVREKELLALFREPPNRRNRDNECQKAGAIVNDIKWVKALEYVMRYADVLKDNETVIQMSKGDTSKISELIPYVESVIWGCQKGGIDCVKALQDYISYVFGPEVSAQLSNFSRVTPELKECFASVLPTEKEVKSYLIELCNRTGLSLESMNEIGHGLSVSALADFPDPHSKPSGPPTQPTHQIPFGSNQGQQPFPGHGHPSSGYPGNYQQGYPQNNYNQGGFPQGSYGGDYPQNSYPPSGYPQQSGYPQGNYGQGNFPQGDHHHQQQQGGFSQGGYGYPQESVPQNSYPQGGFDQPGQPSSGAYQQPGSGYPQFEGYPSSNFNPNIYEQYKQAPGRPSNLTFGADSRHASSSGQQSQGSLPDPGFGGGYPAFQKFGSDVPTGKLGSGDPLDELDMRLKNIKSGL